MELVTDSSCQACLDRELKLPEDVDPKAMLLAMVGIAGERMDAEEGEFCGSSVKLEGKSPGRTNGCEKNSCEVHGAIRVVVSIEDGRIPAKSLMTCRLVAASCGCRSKMSQVNLTLCACMTNTGKRVVLERVLATCEDGAMLHTSKDILSIGLRFSSW